MASDLLSALIRANLAGGAAALALLLLRGRLRPLIGPSAVYALWLTVPAAAAASLLPARTVEVVIDALPARAVAAASAPAAVDIAALASVLWIAGAALAVLAVGWRQYRFLARFNLPPGRNRRVITAASDKAGPAVVGVLAPRILLPADFKARFSPTQRRVVLAHEGVHLSRGDSRINAAVLLLQCLSWFNPVAHLAARAMRLDQELSCDAMVMARFPKARRAYAEAMLKSQCDVTALPLGCYWPARGPSVLSRRLVMLRAAPLPRSRMVLGLGLAGLMAAGAGAAAWTAQPPRQRLVVAAAQPAQAAATFASAPSSRPTLEPVVLKRSARRAKALVIAAPPQAPTALARTSMSRFFEWTAMPMPQEDGEAVDLVEASGPAAPDGHMPSQTRNSYRNGAYQMRSDFKPVGDKVEVSAKLYKDGAVIGSGMATTVPGETAYISLTNGQMATLTPGQTAYIITRPDTFERYRAYAPPPT